MTTDKASGRWARLPATRPMSTGRRRGSAMSWASRTSTASRAVGKLAFFDFGGTRLFLSNEAGEGAATANRASSTSASRTSTPRSRSSRAAASSSRTRRT